MTDLRQHVSVGTILRQPVIFRLTAIQKRAYKPRRFRTGTPAGSISEDTAVSTLRSYTATALAARWSFIRPSDRHVVAKAECGSSSQNPMPETGLGTNRD